MLSSFKIGHKISVPPGVKAVVMGQIAKQRPLRVGREQLVHFVSSTPYTLRVSAEAICKENFIFHTVGIQVRLAFDETALDALLFDAGDSYYDNVKTISAEGVAKHYGVEESIRAAIQAYVQGQSFFILQNPDAIRQALLPCIQPVCKEVKLVAMIEACTGVTYREPDKTQLAELGVKALSDAEVKKLVEYLDKACLEKDRRDLEASRQQKLNELEIERTEAENQVEIERMRAENEVEIERIKAKAGPEIEQLRRNTLEEQNKSKIAAQDQDNLLKEHEFEIKRQQQKWEEEHIKLNASILALRLQYEAQYNEQKQKAEIGLNEKHQEAEVTLKKMSQEAELALERACLEEEKKLAAMRAEVADAKKAETDEIWRQRKLDMDLKLELESKMAELRANEAARTIGQLATLAEKVHIPAPSYSNIGHLLLNGAENKTGDMMATLLMGLFERAAELVMSPPKATTRGKELAGKGLE